MAVLVGAGCVDTKARLDEFTNTVIDGAVYDASIDAAPRDVPDISGTFYVAFLTAGFNPDPENLVKLIWTFEVEKDGNGQPISLTMTTQSLDIDTRTPTGAPTTKPTVPISPGGEFRLVFDNYTLVDRANPLRTTPLQINMTLDTLIKSADVICGVVSEGMVTSPNPLPLNGSSYVGVRVPPGTVGMNLPAELIECPNVTMPDAGVPDGGAADAAADAAPDAN